MGHEEDTYDASDNAAAVKKALENILHHPEDVNNNGISSIMIRGLLMEETAVVETCVLDYRDDDPSKSSSALICHKLRGLPQRPLYKEISHRLHIMQQQNHVCGGNGDQEEEDGGESSSLSCFLPASHFGLTEIHNLNELIPPPPPLCHNL